MRGEGERGEREVTCCCHCRNGVQLLWRCQDGDFRMDVCISDDGSCQEVLEIDIF